MSFRRNIKRGLALKLDEMLAVAEKAGLEFHLAGQHDQKSHGNWAGGGGVEGDIPANSSTSSRTGGSGGDVNKIPQPGPNGFPEDQYDTKKGKPIPGTDAWLHAHGISPAVWNDRPYVRFEEGDPFESLPSEVQALYEHEPEAKKQLLNMMGQTGGLIMVRKPVPGGENVVPQSRPDAPVVTDMGKRKFRETSLKNAQARLDSMEALSSKEDLVALQQTRVDRAHTALETAKTIDRDGYLEYSNKRAEDAAAHLAEVKDSLPKKGGTGKSIDRKSLTAEQEETLNEAVKQDTRAQKNLADKLDDANHIFGSPVPYTDRHGKERPASTPEEIADKTALYRELETNNATKSIARAEKKLGKINAMDEDGVKAQIAQEVDTARGFRDAAQNAYDKTAAKYLFPPNPSKLKDAIDAGKILGKAGRVNIHGAENVAAFVNTDPAKGGNGRVYLAMEGNIKEDSLLAAVAREQEPGASVISVPSVTLWRHKEMVDVARKYLGNNREVVLIPDADGVNNPRVRNEARAMQALLESAGAHVVVAPPPIPLDSSGKPLHIQRVDKNTGLPVVDSSGNPVYTSKVLQFKTEIPGSPKHTIEELKGVDDYLGLGEGTPPHPVTGERAKGTLGNLAVQRRTTPPIDLTGEVNAGAVMHANNTLRAISLIAGSKDVKADDGSKVRVAAAQIGTSMLAAATGRPSGRAETLRSLKVLENAGIIKIERVFDEEALTRGIRRQNPNMTDARLNELVRAGVISRPSFEEDDTRPVEYGYEETPIISINTSYKGFDGKPRDYTSVDSTPVSLNEYSPPKNTSSRIKSLRNSGLTYEQIADILNVSNATIAEVLA